MRMRRREKVEENIKKKKKKKCLCGIKPNVDDRKWCHTRQR